MLQLVCVGASQLHSIRAAYLERERTGNIDFRLRTFFINDHPYSPCIRIEKGRVLFNERFNRGFKEFLTEHVPSTIFSYLGGSEHVAISLVNSPRPFDVLIPGNGETDSRKDVEVIPYDLMAELCDFHLSGIAHWFPHLRTFCDRPIYHIALPPPVTGDEHIRASAGPLFGQQIERYGIAPHRLRAKLWRLCFEATERLCGKHDVGLIAPPAETLDADSCLAREYRGHDAVHPNTAYGHLLLDRMIAIAREHC